ncbi:hypothetical protein ADL12_41360 [Streptomyces regalis]|uniref:Uncharacterized protein n=1 Tax=Streptomyces regalis TaxID=68262 RepID=A0A101J9S3_9ACTN|nr:hypothetical protein ADL12_41360 [Streptomyces regalis]
MDFSTRSGSSAWSSSDRAVSSERSQDTAALIAASGVRRSRLTGARRAVRMRLGLTAATVFAILTFPGLVLTAVLSGIRTG